MARAALRPSCQGLGRLRHLGQHARRHARLLVGPPKIEDEWGTGLIPGDDLLEWSRRPGTADALDGVVVQHWRNVGDAALPRWHKDGLSTLGFKSYEQGRRKWQGETLDFVGFDEEPDEDIYTEGRRAPTHQRPGVADLHTAARHVARRPLIPRRRRRTGFETGVIARPRRDPKQSGLLVLGAWFASSPTAPGNDAR